MRNKIIILIQPDGDLVGGAQRRYLNVIKNILDTNDNYYVVLNRCLYNNAIEKGILKPCNRLISVYIPFIKCVSYKGNSDNAKGKKYEKNKISKLRVFLGGIKQLIKLHIKWMVYSYNMLKIIKQYKIDTVYAIWYGGIWVWTLKYIYKFKLIYSYNDSGHSSVKKGFFNWLSSEYYVLKHANKIDFLSGDLVKGLNKKGIVISQKKVLITPNSFIDYTNYKPAKIKENKIVFLGRISSIKNPLLLAETISMIDHKLKKYNYIVEVYGHGPLLNELREYIEKKDIQSFKLKGSTTKPWEILGTSKIFVSIQNNNNYPSQSLIEAMACENAIVASDVGETRKLVTEREGILVELNKESIADAIIYLLENPEECRIKGKNARKKVLEEQSIEKFMNYFIEITK